MFINNKYKFTFKIRINYAFAFIISYFIPPLRCMNMKNVVWWSAFRQRIRFG